MRGLEDEDGIDGPWNRMMDRAMKEDARMTEPKIKRPRKPKAEMVINCCRCHSDLYCDAEFSQHLGQPFVVASSGGAPMAVVLMSYQEPIVAACVACISRFIRSEDK
jgi:hypothetical protein